MISLPESLWSQRAEDILTRKPSRPWHARSWDLGVIVLLSLLMEADPLWTKMKSMPMSLSWKKRGDM